MNKLTREEMFRRFESALPEPTTELDYRGAFELLIAVILSAQATDKSVNLATAGLFEAAPTPEAMIGLGLEGIKSHVRTIGLFNAKSENILKTCRLLIDEHGGAVPETREALQALPGVGRKTANVILNTAFGQETMAVDTHIFRVSNRTGLAKGKTVRAVEDRLMKVIPKSYRRHAHHWLILHGRYVCTARRPRCPTCPVIDLCDYRAKTTSES